MASLEERFEAKVDRTGDHHIWTGSKLRDGTGKLKVDGKTVTARRVAWELEHGPLPDGQEVKACPVDKGCVRIDHLSLRGQVADLQAPARQPRAAKGAGSKREIRPGVWELSVTHGRYSDGSPRREYKTIEADGEVEAEREKAAFVTEVQQSVPLEDRSLRDITVKDAVEQFLEEHLRGELGREERTIRGYRQIHEQWFAPEIDHRRLRDIDEATMERLFGNMRRAGLSRSRMNNAKSLYQPLFRWAKRRKIMRRSPMAEFQLGKSLYTPKKRVPPEVDQLCRYLAVAAEVVPEIAPVLAAGATTGMRLGELVAIRRSRLDPARIKITVDIAADVKGVKGTKTDETREVEVDPETMTMLLNHCERMDERAATAGVQIVPDAFVFSLQLDCSERMPPDYVSKKILVLKEHLGIANKSLDVVTREDEALRLFRPQPGPRPAGRPGPRSKGAMSYTEIGRRLGRSSRWAAMAVASAQRRETAGLHSDVELFDGSAIALRKFTSTELLESGFNVAAVADRQGHSPQVLLKHYATSRPSASRKATEHLGRLVHQGKTPDIGDETPLL